MLNSVAPLKYCELFGNLKDEELARLAPMCSDYAVVEDAMVFTEGGSASHMYVLKEGKLALQKAIRTPNARSPRRTTVAFCDPEEIVGWSSLVDPFKYTLSAVAWNSSRLIRIDARQLRKVLESYPEMGFKVMSSLSSVMSRRLRQTTESLISQREVSYYDKGA